MPSKNGDVAQALLHTLQSPNVPDRNLEPANVVDVLADLAHSGNRIASAILPAGAVAGKDAAGGTVDSLTEAVMGVTSGLVKIADAIHDLAEAIRDGNRN